MSVIKIRFFTIADYEDEEIWLREQHQKGLRLVKTVVPCFYIFEECTPEDVVYRLDYKNNQEDGDYFRLFADYGWEYFNRCIGWLYFRKPASEMQSEEDGEIFSDGASRVDMIQHIIKTRMLPLLVVFFACVLPQWYHTIRDDWGSGDTVFTAVVTAVLLLYLYLFLHCGRKLKKLKDKYTCE